MKIEDFSIGMTFMSSGGCYYKCTDVGTRTITAIRLPTTNSEDLNKFYQGPPYMIKEEVFDEHGIKSCSKSVKDAINDSIEEKHPGYDSNAMREFFSDKQYPAQKFPFKNLLHYDRLIDNSIMHPYRVIWDDNSNWIIKTYDIFNKVFKDYTLDEFIDYKIASETDYEQFMINYKANKDCK